MNVIVLWFVSYCEVGDLQKLNETALHMDACVS